MRTDSWTSWVARWNRSVFFKLGFEILSGSTSLWTSWVTHTHARRGTFWNVGEHRTDSWLWRCLLHLRLPIKEVIQGLSNGMSSTDFNVLLRPDGKLDTRLLYDSLRCRGPTLAWCDLIWNKVRAKKWSFRFWLAFRDRLPTLARLSKRGINVLDVCPLCKGGSESGSHLWGDCAFVKDVMDVVWRWQGVDIRLASLHAWVDWFLASSGKKKRISKMRLLTLLGIVYFVWEMRNRVVFDGIVPTVDACSSMIMQGCSLRFDVCCKKRTRIRRRVTSS